VVLIFVLSQETKIKGYVNLTGYKVIADENLDPGRYAFKIVHDNDKPHFFSSDEQLVVREWMKAIMKTSIERDYSRTSITFHGLRSLTSIAPVSFQESWFPHALCPPFPSWLLRP
jgi:hypothetical protein